MDPKDTASPVATNVSKKKNWFGVVVCCVIAVPVPVVKPMPKKEVAKKQDEDDDDDVGSSTENAQGQENSYNVFYTPPAGWRAMVWHPDPDSVGAALFSPDYTSIDDPSPQTGLSILIYQFPGEFDSMAKLKPAVGMLSLNQTTVAGYPAYLSIFNDSDSGRYLIDYDILKDEDRWLVRIDYPGTSYASMQQEEQKYSIQVNQLLQSIQFKAIQNQ